MSNVVLENIKSRTVASKVRWLIVLVLFSSVLVGFFDRISVAVLFNNPEFYTAIGTGFNPTKLGLLMSAFLTAYGISSVVLSVVGDLWGPGRMLAISTAIWGALMAVMGATSSYGAMMVSRVLLGIMEGPQFSLIGKIVHRTFPARERARANSVWMVGSPIGSAIGLPLTLWLVTDYGWRASFYILGTLSTLIVAPLIFCVVRESPADKVIERQPRPPREKIQMGLFLRNYKFWLVTFYGCGLLMYLWGLNSWLPTYLARSRHFDLRQMGIYSSLPFIAMFVGEVLSGQIADKTGRRALMCFIGLLGAGCLMYAGTKIADPHLAAIVIALSAGSWGLGLPAQYALVMDVVPVSVTAAGIGVKNGVSNLVGAIAPALIGWIVGRTGSFDSGLMVIVISAVVGSLFVLPLIRKH